MATKRTRAVRAVEKLSKATIQKHVDILEKLAKKGKGKLPTYSWLNKNGYFRSYEVARLNPSAFKHIFKNRSFAR